MVDFRSEEVAAIFGYIREYWPSEVREEWRVGEEEYPRILGRVLADFTEGASRGRRFFRVAGQSGSGKTTQLLPAVEGWFGVRAAKPIIVAARKFVKYHPHVREIEREYGAENLRKMTDEVSTILMFLTLRELIRGGYDTILDVALIDPMVEEMLMEMLMAAKYEAFFTMVAVARGISEGFIRERQGASGREGVYGQGGSCGEEGRVVAKGTAEEFWRATRLSMRFYAEKYPEMSIILWSAWDLGPIYEGEFRGAVEVWEKYVGIRELPEGRASEEEMREAKIKYFRELAGGA
jgi:hypothetical protein